MTLQPIRSAERTHPRTTRAKRHAQPGQVQRSGPTETLSHTFPGSKRGGASHAKSNRRSILAVAEYDFPEDLRNAQLRLHQASVAYRALCRALPWSADPAPGWAAGEKQPYTDYTSAKPDSPGYSEHEKGKVARLRGNVLELSITVSTHPYWATLAPGTGADRRMALKPSAPAAGGEAAAAPGGGAVERAA